MLYAPSPSASEIPILHESSAKRRTSIEPNIGRIYDEKKTFFRKKEMDAAQKPEKIAFNGKS